ncbi:MAG: hypothetical protein K0M45_07430 [Candidatus Paracaedibacteraceae bacterium]|nr:hypothetical protein [Candidatus Paracaedibacteraceae bacterium]
MPIDSNHFIIYNAEEENFENFDICIFNTESDISERLIPQALKGGAYAGDSSSKYRLNHDVPLIIPPVNKDKISLHKKLYAHTNCLASPIATVIHPLYNFNPITRVNAVTTNRLLARVKKP